uniref:Uncharacterized protein TCIL3000_11_11310 n=1 Tax=Trypanosoma congolense (strain IL3000) TaxID=1068625 RepID=G0V1X1_TRYCI|nr:unnamed protein product [Trypanosoma congolense IL3000]
MYIRIYIIVSFFFFHSFFSLEQQSLFVAPSLVRVGAPYLAVGGRKQKSYISEARKKKTYFAAQQCHLHRHKKQVVNCCFSATFDRRDIQVSLRSKKGEKARKGTAAKDRRNHWKSYRRRKKRETRRLILERVKPLFYRRKCVGFNTFKFVPKFLFFVSYFFALPASRQEKGTRRSIG